MNSLTQLDKFKVHVNKFNQNHILIMLASDFNYFLKKIYLKKIKLIFFNDFDMLI
jgi:hypothetical protein